MLYSTCSKCGDVPCMCMLDIQHPLPHGAWERNYKRKTSPIMGAWYWFLLGFISALTSVIITTEHRSVNKDVNPITNQGVINELIPAGAPIEAVNQCRRNGFNPNSNMESKSYE